MAEPAMRGCSAVVAAAALVVAACAVAPTTTAERIASGRFVATAGAGDERRSISGRFTIETQADRRVVELASPIGTTMARIEIAPQLATVTGPNLETISGPDADSLVERLFGWRLPVGGLSDWIEGRPEPSKPAQVRRDGDRVVQIEQEGWTIHVAEFFANSGRPRLLNLDRPGSAGNPAITVRLVVDNPTS